MALTEFLPKPYWKVLEDAVYVAVETSGGVDDCVEKLTTTLEADEELSKAIARELMQRPCYKELVGNLVVAERDGGGCDEGEIDDVVALIDGTFEEDLLQLTSEKIWKYLAPESEYGVAKMIRSRVRKSVRAYYHGRPTDPRLKHIPSDLVEEYREVEPKRRERTKSSTSFGEGERSSQSRHSRKRGRDPNDVGHTGFEGRRPHKRRWGPAMINSEISQSRPHTTPTPPWKHLPGLVPPSEPYSGELRQNEGRNDHFQSQQTGYSGRWSSGGDRDREHHGGGGRQGWGQHNEGNGGRYQGNAAWSRGGNHHNDGYSRHRERRWDRNNHRDNRGFNQPHGWGNNRRGSNEGGRGWSRQDRYDAYKKY